MAVVDGQAPDAALRPARLRAVPGAVGAVSQRRRLLELLELLGVERGVFVGGSLGGRVALEVAVARPAAVAALGS